MEADNEINLLGPPGNVETKIPQFSYPWPSLASSELISSETPPLSLSSLFFPIFPAVPSRTVLLISKMFALLTHKFQKSSK